MFTNKKFNRLIICKKGTTYMVICTPILVSRRHHLGWWSVPLCPPPLLDSSAFGRRPCLLHLNYWSHSLRFPWRRHLPLPLLPLHDRPPSMNPTWCSACSSCCSRHTKLLRYSIKLAHRDQISPLPSSFLSGSQHLIERDSEYRNEWVVCEIFNTHVPLHTNWHQLC